MEEAPTDKVAETGGNMTRKFRAVCKSVCGQTYALKFLRRFLAPEARRRDGIVGKESRFFL
jgi:hypothetical protein